MLSQTTSQKPAGLPQSTSPLNPERLPQTTYKMPERVSDGMIPIALYSQPETTNQMPKRLEIPSRVKERISSLRGGEPLHSKTTLRGERLSCLSRERNSQNSDKSRDYRITKPSSSTFTTSTSTSKMLDRHNAGSKSSIGAYKDDTANITKDCRTEFERLSKRAALNYREELRRAIVQGDDRISAELRED